MRKVEVKTNPVINGTKVRVVGLDVENQHVLYKSADSEEVIRVAVKDVEVTGAPRNEFFYLDNTGDMWYTHNGVHTQGYITDDLELNTYDLTCGYSNYESDTFLKVQGEKDSECDKFKSAIDQGLKGRVLSHFGLYDEYLMAFVKLPTGEYEIIASVYTFEAFEMYEDMYVTLDLWYPDVLVHDVDEDGSFNL